MYPLIHTKNKNVIAIFPAARCGSKRLPNKHFLKINSKLSFTDGFGCRNY